MGEMGSPHMGKNGLCKKKENLISVIWEYAPRPHAMSPTTSTATGLPNTKLEIIKVTIDPPFGTPSDCPSRRRALSAAVSDEASWTEECAPAPAPLPPHICHNLPLTSDL
jgi:hypothetical protein